MKAKSPQALSTRCVHAGEARDAHGSPHTPVYTTTTFSFPSTRALLDVVEGVKPGSLYTRYGLNPTIQSLEGKLASLEGGEAALAFSSCMGAEAALFLAHGRNGIVCLGDAYGGTLELLADQLPQLGIRTALLLGNEQQPLALGADLVVHSATKYLGGHSDITAGALMGPADLVASVAGWRKNLGTVRAPETAAMLARSIRGGR